MTTPDPLELAAQQFAEMAGRSCCNRSTFICRRCLGEVVRVYLTAAIEQLGKSPQVAFGNGDHYVHVSKARLLSALLPRGEGQ